MFQHILHIRIRIIPDVLRQAFEPGDLLRGGIGAIGRNLRSGGWLGRLRRLAVLSRACGTLRLTRRGILAGRGMVQDIFLNPGSSGFIPEAVPSLC
jgi:hypothetical protein